MMVPSLNHPQNEQPDSQRQEAPSFPSGEDLRAQVLVVEDDPQIAMMIVAALQTLYRVTTASDGQEGLEQALALRPDLMLCDVSMPCMSGEQLVKVLRARPDFDDMPIVVLSVYSDEQFRIQLLRAGAQDYLLKPFHHEELQLRVANLLSMRQVRQILQGDVVDKSRDLATLASKVAMRQRELVLAHGQLLERVARLQEQSKDLMTVNANLQEANHVLSHAADTVHQLASIVESSGEAIYSITLEGVITSWNSSAEHLYGYAVGEIIGKPISLIIPLDRQEELPRILERIRAGEATKHYETVRVRKDGTLIEVSVTVSPIRDIAGNIIGASTIAHDIAERKRTEAVIRRSHDELMATNADLEEANLVSSQFLATMSHELRTPLACIIGFGELLLEEAQEAGWSQQHQESLERILTNSEHLLGLINDVLDLSKMEAGRMVLDSRPVDPRELLSEVAAEIGSLATKRNLLLRTEVEEGLGSLETNPGKLHQILLNLVSNALKFTEHGGVMLSASRVLLSDEETEGIAFAVQDSGIGIPADLQARVYEAFYQADMSYTRRVGGTGLGLAIVRQLTALLGGTITVASAPGQGSTFTVVLPVKVEDQRFIEQGLPRLHPSQQGNALTSPLTARKFAPALFPDVLNGSGHRDAAAGLHNLILAVDDSADALALIKAALQDTPYTVFGVHDPLQVMRLVQELQPYAITLDVMMPKLNGWQLLHQLKENPATASIPVVMLTVLSEQATGYVLGADDYLIKPFRKEVLRNTLQRVIATTRRGAQLVARAD